MYHICCTYDTHMSLISRHICTIYVAHMIHICHLYLHMYVPYMYHICCTYDTYMKCSNFIYVPCVALYELYVVIYMAYIWRTIYFAIYDIYAKIYEFFYMIHICAFRMGTAVQSLVAIGSVGLIIW